MQLQRMMSKTNLCKATYFDAIHITVLKRKNIRMGNRLVVGKGFAEGRNGREEM